MFQTLSVSFNNGSRCTDITNTEITAGDNELAGVIYMWVPGFYQSHIRSDLFVSDENYNRQSNLGGKLDGNPQNSAMKTFW